MKRSLSIFLVIILIFSTTACTNTNNKNNNPETTVEETTIENQVNLLDTDVLEWVDYKEYDLKADVPVKNIVLMIGDGMGEEIIKASEVVKGDKLVMSSIKNKAMVTTDSLDGLTDSAAAATAISCGIKTKNGYLGVDEQGVAVESICEFAMAKGLKTGLVVTQIVPHATPAGMVAHSSSRSLYNLILRQMLNAEIDVLLGGGNEYYTKKTERNIEESKYQYLSEPKELENINLEKRLLGMFSFQNIIAGKTPSLTTMTKTALDVLNKGDNGFFLMVEGSDIDSFSHQENMEQVLKEMQIFDKSVDYVLNWAEKNPGTLVIVTADHETGGVKVPENPKPEDINDTCFTSDGKHTDVPVNIMAAGAQSDKLFKQDSTIDNTEISKIMRKVLDDTYGKKDILLKNQADRVGFEESLDPAA